MESKLLTKYTEFQQNTSQQEWDINYLGLGLGGEIGELLNEIKKIKRDDNDILTPTRKDKIEKEMGDILWYFVGISNLLNIPIEKIFTSNMEKLENKKEEFIFASNDDLLNLGSPWG